MELLKYVLPSEVVDKVRLYHSHPVADIMREEINNCVQQYVAINNEYEYEYGGEESFVVCYFKLQQWLKEENDHVRMWEYIRQLEAQGHVLTDRDIKFIGYRFNQ